ncbi:unnamed protein product, partial [Protopolystoma xenopodis]
MSVSGCGFAGRLAASLSKPVLLGLSDWLTVGMPLVTDWSTRRDGKSPILIGRHVEQRQRAHRLLSRSVGPQMRHAVDPTTCRQVGVPLSQSGRRDRAKTGRPPTPTATWRRQQMNSCFPLPNTPFPPHPFADSNSSQAGQVHLDAGQPTRATRRVESSGAAFPRHPREEAGS